MLTINALKNKMIVMIDGVPYQILEVRHLHMGRGGSSVQTRIRNLRSGQVFSRNFKPADTFIQADIEKRTLLFIYTHRGEYVFAEKDDPKNRSSLKSEAIGDSGRWLKPNCEVEAIFLSGRLLGVNAPIKMDFVVSEAPSGFKGDTAQGGTKAVTIETGTKIQTPLFINAGDVIRINTETGEYVERVSKSENS